VDLTDFPKNIANAQLKLLQCDQVVRGMQRLYESEIGKIKSAIAFDGTLKNEQQRAAKQFELMDCEELRSITNMVAKAQDDKTVALIELDLVRNQFAVAKLQTRQDLARLPEEY
jgi:hypothetical protein